MNSTIIRRRTMDRQALRRSRLLRVETLENRSLLAVLLGDLPDWVEQGPGRVTNGQTENLPQNNQVIGAVEALAPHPFDSDIAYAATVVGGIWRTENATDPNPTWTPQTDQLASLSISAIKFDPLTCAAAGDPCTTLYAGTGGFSSGGLDGNAIGLLKTTDGINWFELDPSAADPLANLRIRSVVPTSVLDAVTNQQVVLVATVDGGGLFRSTDAGATFTLISGAVGSGLPAGSASHVVADPSNANRFYAGVPGQGVFRSDNAGLNWTPVNTGIVGIAGSFRIELAVSAAAPNPVYAALIGGGGQLSGIFRTANQGANWTQLDTPATNEGGGNLIGLHPRAKDVSGPGGQGITHFSIVADPNDPNIVFVGGDRQPRTGPDGIERTGDDAFPNAAGCTDFSGRHFRGDASQASGSQFAPINCNGANGTSPHADSRDMVFDADGNILESDDGGIYRLVNPNAGGRVWRSAIGDIRVAQFFSTAYDNVNNLILGGTQDTGVPEQNNFNDPTWFSHTTADGGVVAVDTTSSPGDEFHYFSNQNFGGFSRHTEGGATVGVPLTVNGAGGSNLANVERMAVGGSSLQFRQVYVLNEVDPSMMLIGTNFLYESPGTRGNTLDSLSGLTNLNADTIDNDNDGATDEGDEFRPTNPIGGSVRGMAYGGRSGGVDNVDVAYVGAGGRVFVRTANTTNTLADFVQSPTYPGGTPTDIVLDPDEWRIAYVTDGNNVFRTADAGATWTNITGNLSALTNQIQSIELFTPTVGGGTPTLGDDVILVAGLSGVFRTLNPLAGAAAIWTDFGGTDLPNMLATDLQYDLTDDRLIAGTYGRGAWVINDASAVLEDESSVLTVCGDEDFVNQDDVITLIRDSGNPTLLNVLINGVLKTTLPIAAISQINVFGVGGNDNLVVDSTSGLISVIRGIRYDGDGKCPSVFDDFFDSNSGAGYDRGIDRLTLLQAGGPVHATSSYAMGPQIGSGTYVVGDPGVGNTQTVFFEELEPIVDVVPTTTHTITATPENNAITYTAGPNNGLVNALNPAGNLTALLTVDNYESSEFSNKVNVVINAGSGNDAVVVNNGGLPTGLATLTINGENGDDQVKFLAVPTAAPAAFISVTANGGAGDDVIDARAILANTPFFINGGSENDTLTGGRGNDTIHGDEGDDTLAGGDAAVNPAIGNNTYDGGNGFDTLLILGTNSADTMSVFLQANGTALTNSVNGAVSTETFASVELADIKAKQGNDLIRVTTADTLGATSIQRFWVEGDLPNASDRLIVNDDGVGDLVIVRQAEDGHSGRISVAPGAPIPPPEVVYDGIERLDILPVDPITGGTGTGGGGLIKVFHADPFELNDNRTIAGQLARVAESPTSPTIDPGGIVNPFGDGQDIPGDEDWYEFRPQATGTFEVKALFDLLATVPSGRPGLPGAGNLDLEIRDATGALIVTGVAVTGGKSAVFAATNDPAFPQFNRIFVRVRGASADSINVYDFDNLQGVATGNPGVGNVDIFGPQVTDVTINNLTTAQYNLFGIKPGNATQGPTPLVNSLVVHLRDLPARVAGFLYPTLDSGLTPDEARGLFEVKGDANGLVAIDHIEITNPVPAAVGVIPEATIRIVFKQPLPDDRFTLTISDSLRDPAGNALDGESNADEPNVTPFFPSGDGNSGGNFVARFTVDSRAELGSWASGSIYVDTNGNFHFDPTNTDFTNRDISYVLGFTSDNIFAGNFSNGLPADGFDKLGAYGKVGTNFRWLIDTDNNGVADVSVVQPLFAGVTSVNGMPAAGNFDNNVANGDEVVLKVGNIWLVDTNHDFKVDKKLPGSNMVGLPIVGDFDGDGIDDLGAWADDKFSLNLSTLGPIDGTTDRTFNFGFAGTRERPVAANFDGDKFDDLGLWVPDRGGVAPHEAAEWYLLVSGGTSIVDRLINNGGAINYKPTPFGNDLYAQFGDEFGLPVVGNFDPPLTSALDDAPNTNPQDELDVNNDGEVTPLDALLIFNLLNSGQTQPAAISVSGTSFVDINNDGEISPLDALLIINHLNSQPPASPSPDEGEGEGEAVAVESTDAFFANLVATDDSAIGVKARSRR